jgi:hypothetical protein
MMRVFSLALVEAGMDGVRLIFSLCNALIFSRGLDLPDVCRWHARGYLELHSAHIVDGMAMHGSLNALSSTVAHYALCTAG